MQAHEVKVDFDPTANDLGPLAWVLEELRKSLDGAAKAMRRFVRDADSALGADIASLDTSHLRIARQQLHQAEGALAMVGLAMPAILLRAMEAVAQRFVQRPELCTHEQVQTVERASFALVEYLEALLRARDVSPVVLFPQYRDLQQIVGEERIHPADLWPMAWRWIDLDGDPSVTALLYDQSNRTRFDQSILKVIKTGNPVSADRLRELCLGFAAAQAQAKARTFWTICAAYFEGFAGGWLTNDVYTKRSSSRVLSQYIALARGDVQQLDRLAQDLLFFVAQAVSAVDAPAPTLLRVAQAYGIAKTQKPVNYEARLFGRYDPSLLLQARKRVGVAKETWAVLSGGDAQKLRSAADQFGLVSESLIALNPDNLQLAQALTRAMDATLRSGQPPTPQVALEVATSVLFLEAAYDEIDPEDTQLAQRSGLLAQRLDLVVQGAAPQALEPWMEELYRRVSERQTMGSVVSELSATMGQLEKSMDHFFRNPQDKSVLQQVPTQLAQMRGVLSLLGLDHAAMAVLNMRDSVEQILVGQTDPQSAKASGTFERLGGNLGAMGFMVDMLSYQPTVAKKMFVFDPATAEFRSVMGRAVGASTEPTLPTASPAASVPLNLTPVVAPPVAVVPPTVTSAPVVQADEDQELRDIFLEEAREVVQTGLLAVSALETKADDIAEQTSLRRSFHTLKGSSRMVRLNEFGEAAWALEQLLNSWIAEQHAANDDLRGVAFEALHGFDAWLDDIAAQQGEAWKSEPFRAMADALRLSGQRLPLRRPDGKAAPAVTPESRSVVVESESEAMSTDNSLPAPSELAAFYAATASPAAAVDFADIDFGFLEQDSSATQAAPLSAHAPLDFELLTADADQPPPAPLAEPAPPVAPPVPAPLTVELAQPASSLAALEVDLADIEVTELPLSALASWNEPVVEATAPVSKPPEPEPIEEEVKVIGPLRIGIPLYNVYLNEADEWSRRLVTELAEWAMELPTPVNDSTVALAHSLAGSSATVGFVQLSSVARDLEYALEHVRLQGRGTAYHGELFSDAAQDIRRLLHQFAAGFIKEADAKIVQSLKNVCDTEVVEFVDSDRSHDAPLVTVATVDDDAPPLVVEPAASVATAPVAETVVATSVVVAKVEAPVDSAQPGRQAAPSMAARALPKTRDDIDVQDAIDADLFPIFEEEALGLLPSLAGALRQWAARPGNLGARAEVLRSLHTLKGSARLAGALRLGEMAHQIESTIESLGSEAIQSNHIEPLLSDFDTLQASFDALRRADAALLEAVVGTTTELAVSPAQMPQSVNAAIPPSVMPSAVPKAVGVSAVLAQGGRGTTLQSVRVRPQLLDRLVNQAGEVMMTRSRLEDGLSQLGGSLGELTGNLDKLRQQLRDIELQAETQMQSRLAQSKDSAQGFDPLEFDRFTRVQELTRMMAESVNDVATVQRNLQRAVETTEDSLVAQARQTRDLQRDLLRTRMVEFESIAERLYGVVRQAGKDAAKQVRLDIVGGSIELDRSVLDRMTPAFEHLLRNCVGHGIEAAEARLAAGKDATGTVTVNLVQEGNDVSVQFVDDGAGLNLPRIKERALAMGLLGASDELTATRAAELIYLPGFSTAQQVTELAGRGIGMDVVRAEINALGGRIETESEAGKGSRFTLVFPLTTAVTQVVILRAGNLTVGVPANLVETVKRVKPEQLAQAYAGGEFHDGSGALPFYWSGALLQASARSQETDAKTFSVIIFRSAGQRVAVHVDEVLGNQEVVVKNLGTQLARLPGLAAMTVLASGAVVLIYNPVALATVYGEQARQLGLQPQAEGPSGKRGPTAGADGVVRADTDAQARLPLVLVVDDSITVRRVTQRLLLREGYRVSLAIDGLQALERLREEIPAVVLTDIEMPRMDGFDLARNIRADARMKHLPIVTITSRIADKHREHAGELGVNHYLGKPYPEEELLSLVRGYCAIPQTVPVV